MEQDFGQGGVFVLGGSGGIGGGICEAFAKAGVPVALSYHNNAEAAGTRAEAVRAYGVEAYTHQLDVSDRAAVASALASAAEAMGGLHSVVYAGGPQVALDIFAETPESDWRNWLENDVLGAIILAQEAIPYLRKTRGAFTSLSTYQGELVEERGGLSAVSKAAIDRMVKVIAKEEGKHGVRANSVRCGWIAVDMVTRLFEQMPALREQRNGKVPLGRLGYPHEIGDTIVFLSSRRGGFITGVNLMVDGGESL